jgi:hypothetical protein
MRPKSVNDWASQLNSTRVPVSSAFSAYDPIQKNDAEGAEPTASSKYNGSILANLVDLAHHPDPTAPFQSVRPLSSSVPDLPGSAVGQGELQYACSLCLKE